MHVSRQTYHNMLCTHYVLVLTLSLKHASLVLLPIHGESRSCSLDGDSRKSSVFKSSLSAVGATVSGNESNCPSSNASVALRKSSLISGEMERILWDVLVVLAMCAVGRLSVHGEAGGVVQAMRST